MGGTTVSSVSLGFFAGTPPGVGGTGLSETAPVALLIGLLIGVVPVLGELDTDGLPVSERGEAGGVPDTLRKALGLARLKGVLGRLPLGDV